MTSNRSLLLLSLLTVGSAGACSQTATQPGTSTSADTMQNAPVIAGSAAQATQPMSRGSNDPVRAASGGSTSTATATSGGAGSRASTPGAAAGSGGAGRVAARATPSTSSLGGAGSTPAQAGRGGDSQQAAGRSAGGAGQSAGGSDAASAPMRPSTWRIALLGDSITETTCTSQLVWSGLHAQGRTNFELVGTKQNQQGCGVDNADRDCEGHSGYLVTEIARGGPKAAELPMWCASDRADLALMHFGTNDAWHSDIPIADIVSAYSDVVAALRAVQPHVIVLVAQIIPLRPDNCSDCDARVRALNEQIPMWAAAQSTPESPIFVVDQWTGFDTAADTGDRVHPNLQGSQKMADVWLAALRAHNIF